MIMESACLRHTEIPGTSTLFSDFQYRFDRVAQYYSGWPGDPASYDRAAAAIDYPDERRAALVEALQRSWDPAALRATVQYLSWAEASRGYAATLEDAVREWRAALPDRRRTAEVRTG